MKHSSFEGSRSHPSKMAKWPIIAHKVNEGVIKRSVIAYGQHCHDNQWFCFILNSHAYHNLRFLCPFQHGLCHIELLGDWCWKFLCCDKPCTERKTPYLAGFELRLIACRANFKVWELLYIIAFPFNRVWVMLESKLLLFINWLYVLC